VSEKKDESQPSTLSEAQAEEAVAKAEFEAAKEEAQKQNLMMAHLDQQQFQMQ